MAKPLIATFLAMALAGCGGFAQMGRARTLDPGEWEFGGSVTLVAQEDEAWTTDEYAAVDSYNPPGGFSPELRTAYGLTPRVELGARVYQTGGELTVKTQLVRSEPFDLSIAPSVFGGALQRPGDEQGAYARLPLLAGLNVYPRTSLVFAPEVAWALDRGGDALPELWGGTASAHYRALDGTRLAIGFTWLRFQRRVPFPAGETHGLTSTNVLAVTIAGGRTRDAD